MCMNPSHRFVVLGSVREHEKNICEQMQDLMTSEYAYEKYLRYYTSKDHISYFILLKNMPYNWF